MSVMFGTPIEKHRKWRRKKMLQPAYCNNDVDHQRHGSNCNVYSNHFAYAIRTLDLIPSNCSFSLQLWKVLVSVTAVVYYQR